MAPPLYSRREFLILSCVGLSAAVDRRFVFRSSDTHPTPRPGINASKVLKVSEIDGDKDVVTAFDEVRQIPEIVDGIRCHCGCAGRPDNYSLLTCYEGPDAMAQHCEQCQGHGRYAFRLHKAGKSLDEIRAAIDDRYGS